MQVSPGKLKPAYENALEGLRASDAVGRLWSKDASLWPIDPAVQERMDRLLKWQDLPDELQKTVEPAVRSAVKSKEEFDDVVFLGMGSSNLVAELLPSLGLATRGKRFFVLDSIHPEDIRALERSIQLPRTLFLLASKTGRVLELHDLFLYFFQQLKKAGVASPGQHFMASTEDDSYLRTLSGQYKFRQSFLEPDGFLGRFSGLLHLGLLLTALCEKDVSPLAASAKEMREACGPRPRLEGHAAASLAALLAAGAMEGHERLAVLTHEKLMPTAYLLGKLVGASTCSEGEGIIPLFGITPSEAISIKGGYTAVCLKLAELPDPGLEQAARFFEHNGTPSVTVELEKAEDLCAEIFRWEVATCLACVLLKKNPFLLGDRRQLWAIALKHLEEKRAPYGKTGTKPRIQQDDIELYAEGAARHEISMLSLEEAVRSVFSWPEADGYMALLSFLPKDQETWRTLQTIRERLEATLRLPVLLNQGPRYLYAAGHAYKNGPAKGAFVMLTEEVDGDIEVPGGEYTFGEMGVALARADLDELTRRRRPAVRLHFKKGTTPSAARLQNLFERARVGIRKATE